MADVGATIGSVHAWLAVLAAALAMGMVAGGLLDAAGIIRGRRLLDRLVLATLATVLAAAILGPLAFATGGPPGDPLHFLYAVLALAAAPVARAEAARRGSARVGAWMVAGGLVTLGALLRLWVTGG